MGNRASCCVEEEKKQKPEDKKVTFSSNMFVTEKTAAEILNSYEMQGKPKKGNGLIMN